MPNEPNWAFLGIATAAMLGMLTLVATWLQNQRKAIRAEQNAERLAFKTEMNGDLNALKAAVAEATTHILDAINGLPPGDGSTVSRRALTEAALALSRVKA